MRAVLLTFYAPPSHKLKKSQLEAEKRLTSFAFFPIVQSYELRGGTSVVLTTMFTTDIVNVVGRETGS